MFVCGSWCLFLLHNNHRVQRTTAKFSASARIFVALAAVLSPNRWELSMQQQRLLTAEEPCRKVRSSICKIAHTLSKMAPGSVSAKHQFYALARGFRHCGRIARILKQMFLHEVADSCDSHWHFLHFRLLLMDWRSSLWVWDQPNLWAMLVSLPSK